MLLALTAVAAGQATAPASQPTGSSGVPPLQLEPLVPDAQIVAAINRATQSLGSGDYRRPKQTVAGRAALALLTVYEMQEPPSPDHVRWLLAQQDATGGWGHGADAPDDYAGWTDIVSTQLTVSVLRSADDAGQDIPDDVFTKALIYVLKSQNEDGGWGLTPPGNLPFRVRGASHGSATAAALATLADCPIRDDELTLDRAKAIAKGLAWLDSHASLTPMPGWVWGRPRQQQYYAYALQYLGRQLGQRTLGSTPIRQAVVQELLTSQAPDGSWPTGPETPQETALAALALVMARQPVLVNCLDLVGSGRDLAPWVRWSGSASWQALTPDDDPMAMAEAPLLYIAVVEEADLPESWWNALYRLAEAGGTIVLAAQTDNAADLDRLAARLAKLLKHWPVLTDTREHMVWSADHTIRSADRPPIRLIGDRVRPVGVVLPKAVIRSLRTGYNDQTRPAFELMTNIAIAATGANPPAGREPYVWFGPPPEFATAQGITVARVKHGGDWNVAPLALRRLSDTLAAAMSVGVIELDPVDLAQSPPEAVLWLTGTTDLKVTVTQQGVLKTWLAGGGTLLIDSAVGDEAFFKAASEMLASMFGEGELKRLPADHPLITGDFGGGVGSDLRTVTYAPAVTNPPPGGGAELYGLEVDGRMAVIVSRYGLTSATEGTPAFGAQNVSTPDARRLGANVLLWALSGANSLP